MDICAMLTLCLIYLSSYLLLCLSLPAIFLSWSLQQKWIFLNTSANILSILPVLCLFIPSSELLLTYFTIVVPYRTPSVFLETCTVLWILYIYLDTSPFPTSFSEGRKWWKKVVGESTSRLLVSWEEINPSTYGPLYTMFSATIYRAETFLPNQETTRKSQ